MAHWADTWPHVVVASVILKDNKIIFWKIGESSLKNSFSIEALIKDHPRYSYQEKKWTVNNDDEHNDIFYKYSREWFKQWEVHEDHVGCSPFEYDDFEKLKLERCESND